MKTHLLVCKPQLPACCAVQRQSLASQLRLGSNVEMLALPLFELLPHEARLAQAHTWMGQPATRTHKIVVCVSPSALEMLCYNMGPWPTQVFCGLMGKQSAALALQLGVPAQCIIAPTGQGEDTEDSEGLSTLIRQRFETGACEILICKGPRGRTELLTSLQVQGHDVQALECYDRQEIRLPPSEVQNVLGLGGPMVLWVTSSETLLALDQQFKTHSPLDYFRFQTFVTVLTTHPRIRGKCTELGYSSVIQIPTGIQSLNEWLQNNTVNMTPERQSDSVTRTHNQRRFDLNLPKWALGLSLLSMVLSLAIGLSSQSQVDKARIAFGERLERETATLDLLKEQVGETGDLSKDLKTRFELLEQTQKEEASQRQSLQEVYNSLLSNRIEVSLSEVEQLLSIAKRQLYVLGNVHGAAVALEQAVDVLAKTDKPTMIALRKALLMDLSEIKALPHTDVMKLAVDLDVLINSVESLPMLSGLVQNPETVKAVLDDDAQTQTDKKDTDPEASSAADTTVQHGPKKSSVSVGELLNSAGTFFKSVWEDILALVQITEVKSVDVLLLSARQEADVKNVLRLSLLNARITLLSSQTELLNADLARSSKLIDTYFDQQAPLVQQAHGVLDSIHQAQLNLVLPELKASTSALRLAQVSQPVPGNKP